MPPKPLKLQSKNSEFELKFQWSSTTQAGNVGAVLASVHWEGLGARGGHHRYRALQ